MGTLISLALYAALAVGALIAVHTAWSNFTGKYKTEGAQAQMVKDQATVDGLVKDRDQWKTAEQQREAENKDLVMKIEVRDEAIKDLADKYAAAKQHTADIQAKQRALDSVRNAAQAGARSIVLSPQPIRPADQEIADINKVVLDALGVIPAPAAKSEGAEK